MSGVSTVLHHLPPCTHSQMIADIDKDGSGTIDFDEFLQVGLLVGAGFVRASVWVVYV